MAQSSVDVVREHIAAFRAQDTPRALSFLDAHVVWDGSRTGGVEAGNVTYGTDPLLDFVRRYRGAFESYEYEVQRLEELAAGSVLAVVTETGFGRTSGVPVNRSFAALYTVLDRKIARITLFRTEDEARQAVG